MSVLDRKTEHALLSAIALALRSGRTLLDVFQSFENLNIATRQPMWKRCVGKLQNAESIVPELNDSFSDDVLIILGTAEVNGVYQDGFEVASVHVRAILTGGQ